MTGMRLQPDIGAGSLALLRMRQFSSAAFVSEFAIGDAVLNRLGLGRAV